jgi:hypothetical protein
MEELGHEKVADFVGDSGLWEVCVSEKRRVSEMRVMRAYIRVVSEIWAWLVGGGGG